MNPTIEISKNEKTHSNQEIIPLLEAHKMMENKVNGVAQSLWVIVFKGDVLFNLLGIYGKKSTCLNGIKVIQITSLLKTGDLSGYDWEYKEQINIDENKPVLDIKEVNRDQRGVILAVEYLGYEVFSLLGTHQGYARGGHSHPYSAKMTMPMGSGTWYLQKGENQAITKIQSKGQELIIDKDEIHYIVAVEDFLLTETPLEKGLTFKAVNDPKTRNIVDKINSERNKQVF